MTRWIAWIAGVLSLGWCGWYAAGNLLFVWKYWWRIPFWDQAAWQMRYAEEGLRGVMLGQFNEHRWVIPAPLYAIDIEWFAASGAFVQALLILAQLATFAWLFAPMLRLNKAAACMLGGLFLVWATWLEQCDNLCWPLQLHTTLCNLQQVAACWFFARGRIGAATGLGVAATFTFGNGILIWPALALASAVRRRWRNAAFFGAVCAACLAIYSIGYQTPAHHTPAMQSLLKPFALAHYFLMYVARPFLPAAILEQITAGTPAFLSPWRSPLPAAIAAIALLAFAWILLRYSRSIAPAFEEHFYVPVMALSLGTGFVVALGRMSMGIKTVLASRYVTLELLFWSSLAATLSWMLFRSKPRPAYVAAWGALVMAAAVSTQPANREMGLFCRERAISLWQETAALRMGVFDEERWRYIVEDPPKVRQLLAKYEREGRLVYGSRRVDPVGGTAPDLRTAEKCHGGVDQVKQVKTASGTALAITGWAWNVSANSDLELILISDPDTNRVIGVGYPGMFRLDVEQRLHDTRLRTSGWVAYTKPRDTVRPVQVWADLGDARYCHLGTAQP